jgi:hypothetical protein
MRAQVVVSRLVHSFDLLWRIRYKNGVMPSTPTSSLHRGQLDDYAPDDVLDWQRTPSVIEDGLAHDQPTKVLDGVPTRSLDLRDCAADIVRGPRFERSPDGGIPELIRRQGIGTRATMPGKDDETYVPILERSLVTC